MNGVVGRANTRELVCCHEASKVADRGFEHAEEAAALGGPEAGRNPGRGVGELGGKAHDVQRIKGVDHRGAQPAQVVDPVQRVRVDLIVACTEPRGARAPASRVSGERDIVAGTQAQV